MTIEEAGYSHGPVSSLPGHVSTPLPGVTCDLCSDPATRRVQGETDSMGCEYLHYCNVHYAENKASFEAPVVGACDWCGTKDVVLKPRRDYEEGMSGRVYDVCSPCIRKDQDRILEGLDNEDIE